MGIGTMMIMVGIDMIMDNNVIIITQVDQTHIDYKGEKIKCTQRDMLSVA